ncbi:MAG TPA: hypothetical protein VGN01_01435 [Acidobacteriaceae bacterium]|jgi:dipeptidyl aminopeptidase/acylaminoacyl peptidase
MPVVQSEMRKTCEDSSKMTPGEVHSVKTCRTSLHIVLLAVAISASCTIPTHAATGSQNNEQRPFTVADDIALARFDDPLQGRPPITVSPDGRLVAVHFERGLLKQNRLEAELCVYDMKVLRAFVNSSPGTMEPKPIWEIKRSTYSEGVLISGVRWMRDSHGLAFLLKSDQGKDQLMLTRLHEPRPLALSLRDQDVLAFDIRDDLHYAYTVRSTNLHQSEREQSMPSVDVTGRSFVSVLFPNYEATLADRSELWAAVGGSPHPVMRSRTREPFIFFDEGQQSMALSPNGSTLGAVLPVDNVPKEWERLYASLEGAETHQLLGGKQDLDVNLGSALIGEYVTIDLRTGTWQTVTGTPTGRSARWVAGGRAAMSWSDDGRFLALPSTFVAGDKFTGETHTPCLAISDRVKHDIRCLMPIESPHTKDGQPNPTYFFIDRLAFDGSSLSMDFRRYSQSKGIAQFSDNSGVWRELSEIQGAEKQGIVNLTIHQDLNNPPVLVAEDAQTNASRAILDPNPQLKTVTLTEAAVYHWTDEAGLKWTGGLYKPSDYTPGRRYPLVIQTHGFDEKLFLPSGTMSTAFAARALAATGIMVLQVRGCPIQYDDAAEEAPCNVRGYEAAVKQLNAEGTIDPTRLGIIGFSRTCYYVMEALTGSSLNFRAASVTDGVNYGYWQYLFAVDLNQNGLAHEAEAIYKGQPFGDGLQHWIKHSPAFKMQKVDTPLLVVGEGATSLLSMWEYYAPLRYLHRPTELVLLRTNEHVLTNPAVRMASQDGSVDWFRFWLQGYEDPNLTKAQQYQRWETLCGQQVSENSGKPTYCVQSQRSHTSKND